MLMMREITCPHCGHRWNYKGQALVPICPSCYKRVREGERRRLPIEERILNCLKRYSPQTFTQLCSHIFHGSTEDIKIPLQNLVQSGKVLFFTIPGRKAHFYAYYDAENLQPYWQRFAEILQSSDKPVPDENLLIELGLSQDSPIAKVLLMTAKIKFPDLLVQTVEAEDGRTYRVYSLPMAYKKEELNSLNEKGKGGDGNGNSSESPAEETQNTQGTC
jgi:DNA-directed RNA polymerase subunit RPC12/RpoP